jgi:hypothetical protein
MRARNTTASSCLVILIAQAFVGCGPTAKNSQISPGSHSFDLGAVPQGATDRFFMPVVNPRDEAITIESWETSCDCLTIRPDRLTIGPHSTKYAIATCNFSNEPDFQGDLRIEVNGRDATGQSHFKDSISLSVVETSNLPAIE